MWYFKGLWLKWHYSHNLNKLRDWAEMLQSECVENVLEGYEKHTKNYKHDMDRWKLKDDKEPVLTTHRNILNIDEQIKHPVFTQNQIASISANWIKEYFVMALLIVCEGVLYILLGKILLPRQFKEDFGWLAIVFAFGLAFAMVAILKHSLKKIYNYLEASMLAKKFNVERYHLSKFKADLIIGVIGVIIFVAVNIASAVIRATLLESSDNREDALSRWLFIISLLLSLVSAYLLALLEKDLAETKEKYRTFLNWKKQHKERKEYGTNIQEMSKKFSDALDRTIEKYWQLMISIRLVFGHEVDEKWAEELQKYDLAIASREVDVHDISKQQYEQYRNIQCARRLLFEYGINQHQKIVQRKEELDADVKKIMDYHNRPKQKVTDEIPIPLVS